MGLYVQHVVGVPVPPGWFAPFREGEHAQVVVGVGGDEQDFIDLCRTGAVAIPSGDNIAFLVRAGGDGISPSHAAAATSDMVTACLRASSSSRHSLKMVAADPISSSAPGSPSMSPMAAFRMRASSSVVIILPAP